MRLEITRSADLALRSIRALHGEGRTSAKDLAVVIDTTPTFLAHVLAPLVRAGYIDSKPGKTGGYLLMVDPCEISVLDLIEIVEGPVADGTCVLRGGPCDSAAVCSLHTPWTRARDALITELDRTSVADC